MRDDEIDLLMWPLFIFLAIVILGELDKLINITKLGSTAVFILFLTLVYLMHKGSKWITKWITDRLVNDKEYYELLEKLEKILEEDRSKKRKNNSKEISNK